MKDMAFCALHGRTDKRSGRRAPASPKSLPIKLELLALTFLCTRLPSRNSIQKIADQGVIRWFRMRNTCLRVLACSTTAGGEPFDTCPLA